MKQQPTLSNNKLNVELLQPWSTFVMKTNLPPPILEKMIKITDEIVENNKNCCVGAGEMEEQFEVDIKILEQEELLEFFLNVCKSYVIQAFCQSKPFDKEKTIKEEYFTHIISMWINSQKANEYFPSHIHRDCTLSTVMFLKIPEYLPSRNIIGRYNSHKGMGTDGAIEFSNSPSQDQIWGNPIMTYQPEVGDFFIFSALQQHQVYPFRTSDGKGERRSVSFNAIFTSKSEQEALKKKKQRKLNLINPSGKKIKKY